MAQLIATVRSDDHEAVIMNRPFVLLSGDSRFKVPGVVLSDADQRAGLFVTSSVAYEAERSQVHVVIGLGACSEGEAATCSPEHGSVAVLDAHLLLQLSQARIQKLAKQTRGERKEL